MLSAFQLADIISILSMLLCHLLTVLQNLNYGNKNGFKSNS